MAGSVMETELHFIKDELVGPFQIEDGQWYVFCIYEKMSQIMHVHGSLRGNEMLHPLGGIEEQYATMLCQGVFLRKRPCQ